MTTKTLLASAAAQAVDDPNALASYLHAYCEREDCSLEDVAERLATDPDNIIRLALCGPPRTDCFSEDVRAMGTACHIDPEQLEPFLRALHDWEGAAEEAADQAHDGSKTMHVVCDHCQTKYSIADTGKKTFKIRCKRCTNVFIVTAAEADASDPAIWYVVIGGEQVGPITQTRLEEELAAGALTGESYVWHEEMSDWQMLSGVPEVAHLLASLPEPSEAPPADDLFSEPPAEGLGGLVAMGGLNDIAVSSPIGFGDEPLSSSSANEASELVSARSENSVLFSLSNLQAIGSPTRDGDAALPTTDGSGLIDIKALAASAPAAQSRPAFSAEAFDDQVIPVPAMMPLGTRRSNTWLIAGIAGGVGLVVSLIAVVVVLLASKNDDKPMPPAQAQAEEEQVEAPDLGVGGSPGQMVVAQNVGETKTGPDQRPVVEGAPGGSVAGQPVAGQPVAGQPVAGQPVAGQPGTPANAVAGQVAANAEGEDTAAAEEEEDNKSRRRRARRTRRGSSSADSASDSKPEKKPEKKPKADDGGKKRSKGEIMGVVKKNFGKIRTCSRNADKKGKLKMNFTIKGDGRTSGVSIGSPEFKGTKVGACVQKVFQSMRFSDSGASQGIKNFPVAIN